MAIQAGQTICAPDYNGKVREWTTVCDAYYESPHEGIVVADPHLTDDERAAVERVTRINQAKRTVLSAGVMVSRAIVEIADIRS